MLLTSAENAFCPSKTFLFFLQENKSPLALHGLGLPHQNEYSILFQQSPKLLTPHFNNTGNTHGVVHHIVTHDSPTHARAQRLDQVKFYAIKAEFLHMGRKKWVSSGARNVFGLHHSFLYLNPMVNGIHVVATGVYIHQLMMTTTLFHIFKILTTI